MKAIMQNNPNTFQTGDLKTIVRPQGTFNLASNKEKASVNITEHTLSVLNDNNVKEHYYIYEDPSHIGGCFWLSSIAMILFIDTHKDYFRDKKVLELGSGIGLPAMHIAKTCTPTFVTMSDKDACITQTSSNSNGMFELSNTEVKYIDWYDNINENEKYDVIIASDCVYRNTQNAFLQTIKKYLKDDGIFIFINAYRDGLDDFIYSLQELYAVSIEELELEFTNSSNNNNTYSIKLAFVIANSNTFVDITHILH
jgi:predicted nicotinamide N-methyase